MNKSTEIEKVKSQINVLKMKMAELWEISQETNQEILDISLEIDKLLNVYYRTGAILEIKSIGFKR